MDFLDQVVKWLRDGGENTEADILARCSIDYYGVDVAVSLMDSREADIMGAIIMAPREILDRIATDLSAEAKRIEEVIKECSYPEMLVRDVEWAPKLADDLDQPVDHEVLEALCVLDSEHVRMAWQKALERRATDPEGAITAARTLLETVLKHILDEGQIDYDDRADLPKLYRLAAEQLNLAPSQHAERVFKQILGGCQTIVGGLGAMRNRFGDAHGKGKKGARPAPRHAELAVNLAGSMASFLIATWEARKE